MKRLAITFLALSFLIAPQLMAQNLQALFYHASFFHPVEGPYVESYLKVFGPSATYKPTKEGLFQASLEVTMVFKQDDEIKDFRKYNLLSETVKDTSGVLPNFIDQQRILLPYGIYQMDVKLKDNYSEEPSLELADMISLEYDLQNLRFSDFQFVEAFSKTEEENVLSKSGYDLVPYVGDWFPEDLNNITFYIELYGLDNKVGAGEDFLFKYYLESFETNVSFDDYSFFQRQKAAPVNVLLNALSIKELPSGNYNLVVEARDRQNELITMNKIFFQRSNPGVKIQLSDLEAVDITATFAEKINDLDSLRFYLGSLLPISNNIERQFVINVLKSTDTEKMQKFLFNFWQNRNKDYPDQEWNFYKKEVLMVEEAYATRIKHGFETDQGRVWLKYGTPDNAEESQHEPNAYPYIIWHYYSLGDQTNKRFIFYNPHLVGTEYILLHSDARGEIYNPYWQVDLHGRNTQLRNYDNYDVDGGWGSRASQKYIK
jgi:GWxTD domain-containing protein